MSSTGRGGGRRRAAGAGAAGAGRRLLDPDPAELEAQPRARHLLVVGHLLGRVQPRPRLHDATACSHVSERQGRAELDVGRDAPPALPLPVAAAVGHGILLASEEGHGRWV